MYIGESIWDTADVEGAATHSGRKWPRREHVENASTREGTEYVHQTNHCWDFSFEEPIHICGVFCKYYNNNNDNNNNSNNNNDNDNNNNNNNNDNNTNNNHNHNNNKNNNNDNDNDNDNNNNNP